MNNNTQINIKLHEHRNMEKCKNLNYDHFITLQAILYNPLCLLNWLPLYQTIKLKGCSDVSTTMILKREHIFL